VLLALTRWVLAHKRIVVTGWLAAAVAGAATAGQTVDRLSTSFDLPGKPAAQANREIERRYASGGLNTPLVLVVRLPKGAAATDPPVARELGTAFGRAAAATPGGRMAWYGTTPAQAFLSGDRRTTFALLYPRSLPGPEPYVVALPAVRAAVAGVRVRGSPVEVTGLDALVASTEEGHGRGLLVETLLGGLAALVVLVWVFGSAIAVVPLAIATVSILTTFLAVLALTHLVEVSFVAQYLVALIGLGIAVDYALLVVMRWREERAAGAEGEEAVERAIARAGTSVLISGTTVAVSLAALVALPVPFMRSIGYSGLLIPLVSVLVALTLLPVALASAGARLEWPRRGAADPVSRRWERMAAAVVRHRVAAALGAAALLAGLAVPALHLQLGTPDVDSVGASGSPQRGLLALERSGIGVGVLSPAEVLVRGDPAAAAARLGRVMGVRGAVAPAAWRRAGGALVDVLGRADVTSAPGRSTLGATRHAARAIPGAQVGGNAAQDADFVEAVYGNLGIVVTVIVVVTLAVLARTLRSVWLPVKALVLNVLSVAAAYGVVVLIWQDGHGSQLLFDVPASGSITTWVPMAIFAFLFGLSMDYEVFMLSRIREEHERSGSTDAAIVQGIARTARLVTSSALILFLAFVALAGIPVTDLQILATGLALGILLDATVVRSILAPALVSLMGTWNWWVPARLARLLRMPDAGRTETES
jgi:putative drug exporter of the RND superfamily